MGASPYQMMPPLAEAEEETLRVSIAKHGVLDPVLIDKEGNVLSGHHRAKIATELGVDYPTKIVELDGEDEKIAFAVAHELGRRHLDREGKRAVAERLSQMGHSLRQIADLTGIPRSTIQNLLNPRPKPATNRKVWELTDEEIEERLPKRADGTYDLPATIDIPATIDDLKASFESSDSFWAVASEKIRRSQWALADAMVIELEDPTDEDFEKISDSSEHSPEALRAMRQAALTWPADIRPAGRGIGAFCTGLPTYELMSLE